MEGRRHSPSRVSANHLLGLGCLAIYMDSGFGEILPQILNLQLILHREPRFPRPQPHNSDACQIMCAPLWLSE